MKNNFTTYASTLVAVFGVGAFAAGCAGQNPTAPTATAPILSPAVTVSSVQVTAGAASGGSLQLTAIAISSDGSSADVTRAAAWHSSDVSLATVTVAGTVTVVGTGNVEFGATFQGVSGSVRVSVAEPVTFMLRGTVRTTDGTVVVGARVQHLGGSQDHAFSDTHGDYSLVGLAPGETIIEVTKTGYAVWGNEIIVTGDGILNVVLSPDAETAQAARR
jgi:hypothetical protein